MNREQCVSDQGTVCQLAIKNWELGIIFDFNYKNKQPASSF